MIYLESDQLEGLRKRARAERTSVAALVHRLVRDYLAGRSGAPAPAREAFTRLVGLMNRAACQDRWAADVRSVDHGQRLAGEPEAQRAHVVAA
jgi:hypothetical protein